MWTHEYKNGKREKVLDSFRKYISPSQSFADHGLLLKKGWPKAFNFCDPTEFIKSVQNDHDYQYATDPDYVTKIQTLVNLLSKIIIKLEF